MYAKSHYVDLETVEFQTCDCVTLPQALVRNGLFPTAPLHPRISVSIDLLDFYSALFDRSADAVTALAGALKTMYSRRGFPLLNSKVISALLASCYSTQTRPAQNEPIKDPFRRGLGQAVQWYDALRRRPDEMVQQAIEECVSLVTPRLAQDPVPFDNDCQYRRSLIVISGRSKC